MNHVKGSRLVAHISVVIPAYNGTSRYLEQAIRSVLAQSYQDCEIIVVDDASTDNTEALVHTFPDVRYVRHARNAGQAAARNTGARLAMASYLAFLDQDDLWEPTFLEETLALLEPATEAALVHCDGYQVNERNEILEYDAAMKQQRSITQLLRGGHDAATSGSLFRRTCFDAVGGYDAALSIWEDIDLIIRALRSGPIHSSSQTALPAPALRTQRVARYPLASRTGWPAPVPRKTRRRLPTRHPRGQCPLARLGGLLCRSRQAPPAGPHARRRSPGVPVSPAPRTAQRENLVASGEIVFYLGWEGRLRRFLADTFNSVPYPRCPTQKHNGRINSFSINRRPGTGRLNRSAHTRSKLAIQ